MLCAESITTLYYLFQLGIFFLSPHFGLFWKNAEHTDWQGVSLTLAESKEKNKRESVLPCIATTQAQVSWYLNPQ